MASMDDVLAVMTDEWMTARRIAGRLGATPRRVRNPLTTLYVNRLVSRREIPPDSTRSRYEWRRV